MSVHYTVTFHMRVGNVAYPTRIVPQLIICHGHYLTPCSLVDVFRRLEEFVFLCPLNGTPYVDSGRMVSLPPYLSDMTFHSRFLSRSVTISQVIRTQIDLTMVLNGNSFLVNLRKPLKLWLQKVNTSWGKRWPPVPCARCFSKKAVIFRL